MRTVVALVITVISVLLSGCGAASGPGVPASASQHRSNSAAGQLSIGSVRALADLVVRRIRSAGNAEMSHSVIKFRAVEYYATVSDAGLPSSFTAFATDTRDFTVQPSSSALVDVVGYSAPRFMTPSERARWQAAGKPPLSAGAVTGQTFSIPTGKFSFIPQGTPLTYQQVKSLPGSPQAIRSEIATHLRPYAGMHPSVTAVLRQLGFLLATAPLATNARSATWSVLVSLPGLHLCGQGRDLVGRYGQWICASTRTDQIEVLLDTRTGSVLAVAERLLKADSHWFPGVPAGSIVQSDAFIPGL